MKRNRSGSDIADASTPQNRMEAIRRLLAEGLTSPTEIAQQVWNRYRLMVSISYVSIVKKRQQPADISGLSIEDLTTLAEIAKRAGGIDRLRTFLETWRALR